MSQFRYHHSIERSTGAETDWRDADYLAKRAMLADLRDCCCYARGRFLDLGCGNKPYFEIFAPHVRSYIGVDADDLHSQPNVVASASNLPFTTASVDTVLATQVLEHVTAPDRMLQEICRVLRPGGHLILTAPQYWRLHEKPHDYYRFTHYGLRYLIRASGLRPLLIKSEGSAWTLIGQAMCNALQGRRLWQRLIPLVNLASRAAERWWLDTGDTLNHIVVARKSSTEKREK